MSLLFSVLAKGGKADLARALSSIESRNGTLVHAGLIDDAARAAKAHIIGLTGPPGVGKSTLTNALVRAWREEGVTVAVIAVDPLPVAHCSAIEPASAPTRTMPGYSSARLPRATGWAGFPIMRLPPSAC